LAAIAAANAARPMAPLTGALARLRPLLPALERDGEVVERIIELLEEKVIPNVQADGGDVIFRGFADGVVYVSMVGACASCSSSTVTVRFMMKNLLTHYIEEVKDVRSIGEDEDLVDLVDPNA
jgi:Fe-S cluster biogenesis protein NfuA